MRPIKFRFWLNNKLQGTRELTPIDGILDMPWSWDTVEQFTGLLDSNGREIYEGDVVTICGRNGVFEIRISLRSGTGFWRGNWELGDDNDPSDPVYINWKGIEVIGNIHEPEGGAR